MKYLEIISFELDGCEYEAVVDVCRKKYIYGDDADGRRGEQREEVAFYIREIKDNSGKLIALFDSKKERAEEIIEKKIMGDVDFA